jgi:FemAB-related protein (PEP-CTERM system-associated)
MRVRLLNADEHRQWDAYVYSHSASNLYQLSGWKDVIERTYGHKAYYLIAVKDAPRANGASNSIVGVLPLVHLKHVLFDNALISTPFFDFGGILADNEQAEKMLLLEALSLARKVGAKKVELRHIEPLSCIDQAQEGTIRSGHCIDGLNGAPCTTKLHKVRMVMALPESSDILMKSFKSKLRSQIMRPIRDGVQARMGGLELLNDFYDVFSINMRDLGSPVHSKKLMENIINGLQDKCKVVMVYKDRQPLAGSVIIGFKGTLENPWASSLKEYSRWNANMLLYWTMLQYACDHGYTHFDFGRSTPDSGTYRFKTQWGATPTALHWHCFSLNGRRAGNGDSDHPRLEKAVEYWQKLPVPVTRAVGPHIRRYIGL